jgi:protein-S-isoprenylcysteine O-methyltransferase Ste14
VQGGENLVARIWTGKNVFWSTVITILGIVCFPANPLVLSGVLETSSYPALFIIGWVVWAFGMVLVMTPIVMFPRRGGIAKGKSFVNTTRLVDTGIYGVVRHPQYLGGIFAVFITTLLWYPHWLFGVLGAIATAVIYISCREEDQRLVQQFGGDYVNYMQKVPRMNILAGVVRLLRHRRIA